MTTEPDTCTCGMYKMPLDGVKRVRELDEQGVRHRIDAPCYRLDAAPPTMRTPVEVRPPDEHDQPMPIHRTGVPSIQDAVIADIENRKAIGVQRYGTLLQPHNGRDMLLDAYEEALDLAIYLKGAIVERDRDG